MTGSPVGHARVRSEVTWGGAVAGYIVLGDRGSQFTSRRFVHARSRQEMVGPMGRVGDAATTPHEELLQSATGECPSPPP